MKKSVKSQSEILALSRDRRDKKNGLQKKQILKQILTFVEISFQWNKVACHRET